MTALVAALLLALGQGAAPGAAPAQDAGRIQRGVAVQPETVTVGTPFRVVVRVRAPRGATIEFPAPPDSMTMVQALDPVAVAPAADSAAGDAVEQTATYRLAAWDVGRLPLRFGEVVVTQGDAVTRLPFGRDLAIEVASVLPADSTERVPKPPRVPFEFGPPWWLWALAALAALLAVLLLWWLWRRRRGAVAPPPDAYVLAQQEFARVEALALVASGERGHHAALMADVVRTYLSREFPAARISLTTTELAAALRGERRVPLQRVVRLLHQVDLVKFAGAPISAEQAGEIGKEARAIVDAVHAARLEPLPAPADVREAA